MPLDKDEVKRLIVTYLGPLFERYGLKPMTNERFDQLINQNKNNKIYQLAQEIVSNEEKLLELMNTDRFPNLDPSPKLIEAYTKLIRVGEDQVSQDFNKRLQEMSGTPEGREKMLQMAAELPADQELPDKTLREQIAKEKYPYKFETSPSTFGRIFQAMQRPGDDEYNRELSKDSATTAGQHRILKAAGRLIVDADLDRIYSSEESAFEYFAKNPVQMQIMQIVGNIREELNRIAAKGDGKDFEKGYFDKFDKNKLDLELALSFKGHAQSYLDPFYVTMPKGMNFEKEYERLLNPDDLENSIKNPDSIPQQDLKDLRRLMTNAISLSFGGKDYNTSAENYWKRKAEEVNKTIGSMREGRKDLLFVDEKGKALPDDKVLYFGERIGVIDELGKNYGFYLDRNAKNVITDSKIPENLLRENLKQTDSSLNTYDELSRATEEFSGLYGDKLKCDREFLFNAPALKDCDYTVPEGMPKETAEILTMCYALDSEGIDEVTVTSSFAADTREIKGDFLAADWVAQKGDRAEGMDRVVRDARRGMTEKLKKIVDGDVAEAKEKFQKIVKSLAKHSLEMPVLNEGSNREVRYAVALADRVATVLKDDKFHLADGLPESTKNAIMLKSNLHQMNMKAEMAKVKLMTQPNMAPEKKKGLITDIITAREINKLMNKNRLELDLVTDMMTVLERTPVPNLQEFGGAHPSNSVVGNVMNQYQGKYRVMNPSAVECAIGQKFDDLAKNVQEAIPADAMERMVNASRFKIIDEIENTKLPSEQIKIPQTKAIVATTKQIEELREAFMAEGIQVSEAKIAQIQHDKETYALGNGHSKASQTIKEDLPVIKNCLDRALQGEPAPSEQLKEMRKVYNELNKLLERGTDNIYMFYGRIHAVANRLNRLGEEYLKAEAEKVDLDQDSIESARYKEVQRITAVSKNIAGYAKSGNEYTLNNAGLCKKDFLRAEDAVHADTLLQNLKEAREVLDKADPFWYRSTPRFKLVQQELDQSIQLLEEYGKKTISSTDCKRMEQSLERLEKMALAYTIKRADASSTLGQRRLAAVQAIHDKVKGQSKIMEKRNFERNTARELVLEGQKYKEGWLKRREEVTSGFKKGQEAAQKLIEPTLNKFRDNPLTSNEKIDPNSVVASLAVKVQSLVNYAKNKEFAPNPLFRKEITQQKNMLADRMILNIIERERSQSKGARVEKLFIQNPKEFKQGLLKHEEITKAMDQYLNSTGDAKVEAAGKLDELAQKTSDKMSEKLAEREKQAKAVQTAKEIKTVQEQNISLGTKK